MKVVCSLVREQLPLYCMRKHSALSHQSGSRGRHSWYSDRFFHARAMQQGHTQSTSVISLLLQLLGNPRLIPNKLTESGGLFFVNSKVQSTFMHLPMCNTCLVQNAFPVLICTLICASSQKKNMCYKISVSKALLLLCTSWYIVGSIII